MEVGHSRSGNRWTVEELSERLTESGVPHTADDLAEALSRLEDSGHLMRAQRQPYSVYPQHLVRKSIRPYDKYDVLAADVCAVLKSRDERFESEDQLQAGSMRTRWTGTQMTWPQHWIIWAGSAG